MNQTLIEHASLADAEKRAYVIADSQAAETVADLRTLEAKTDHVLPASVETFEAEMARIDTAALEAYLEADWSPNDPGLTEHTSA